MMVKRCQAFLSTARELLSWGYAPVILNGKKPIIPNWQRYVAGPAHQGEMELPVHARPLHYTDDLLEAWDRAYPGSNVGVSAADNLAFIDVDDESVMSVIGEVIPWTPHVRRGARGWVFIYSQAGDIKSRNFANRFTKAMLVEVLGSGRQVVLPPSVHPVTDEAYCWVSPGAGEKPTPLGAEKPPVLRQKDVEAIEAALSGAGYINQPRQRGAALGRSLAVEERSRHAAYLKPKIEERVAALRDAVKGNRQDTLNGMVFALAPYVREGVVDETWLEDCTRKLCEANGYIADDGDRAFTRQFHKSLDEGWDKAVADLDAARATRMGEVPESARPLGDEGPSLSDQLHEWHGRWLTGDRELPLAMLAALMAEPGGWVQFDALTIPIRDKKSIKAETKKYIRKQKGETFANEADAMLAELNDTYAFINDRGGKTHVMWENEGSVHFKSVHDFKDMEACRHIFLDDKKIPYAKLWLEHPKRRTYDGVVFDPTMTAAENYYNLWKGFSIQGKAGDWSKLRAHVVEVLASGNIAHADFMLDYFAWCIQNPGLQAEVALVFRGAPGCGKGVVLRTVQELFGVYGKHIADPKHLTGNFNAHLETCCFLYADEVQGTGDRKTEGILKALITEPTFFVEPKYIQAFEAPNRLKVVMSTNSDWAAPVGVGDRRYAVFDVAGHRTGDKAYFKALHHELASGGREAFLEAMRARPVGDWHPRGNIPDTAARREQADRSLSWENAWWLEVLESGRLPGMTEQGVTNFTALADDLYKTTGRRMQPKALSKMMENCGGKLVRTQNKRVWQFPSLAECKSVWAEVHGDRVWLDGEWENIFGACPKI
jgi:hypothetical protein